MVVSSGSRHALFFILKNELIVNKNIQGGNLKKYKGDVLRFTAMGSIKEPVHRFYMGGPRNRPQLKAATGAEIMQKKNN